MQEERRKKQAPAKDSPRSDDRSWLHPDIVVKIIGTIPALQKYYKRKAVVQRVREDKYTADVKLVDSEEVINKLDQVYVETVLPAIGKTVLIVKGGYRGETATLMGIDEETFSATVKLTSGREKGRVVERIGYDEICKLHQS